MSLLQTWLDRISQYVDIADYAAELVPLLTADIVEAIVAAEIDPTSINVERVAEVFARHSIVPPAKLMAHLLMINETAPRGHGAQRPDPLADCRGVGFDSNLQETQVTHDRQTLVERLRRRAFPG
jgi:hypothetical protein